MYDFVVGTTQEQKQAIYDLSDQAKAGDMGAMHKLGMAHVVGCVYNPEAGVTILKAASNAGYVESTRQLASLLHSFDEVRADWPESLLLANSLAERGDLGMQLLAAKLYQLNGGGLTQDLDKSYSMAKSAADRGHAPASTFLGDMYKMGVGVERDVNKALELYQQGLDAGDRSAAGKIQSMKETIVPANSPMDAFYSSKGYSAAPAEQATSVVVYSNSAPRM